MNTHVPKLVAVCLATAFWAGVASAQQADQHQLRSPKESSSQWDQSHTQASTGMPGEVRFSKLKGIDVKSNSGEDLGKVEDLVIDPRGKIQFAVLGSGGLLGIGEKRIPVPWQAVSVQSEKQLTMNIDKEKLKSAPTLKRDFSDLNNPDYVVTIYRFYEVQPSAMGGSQTPGGTTSGSGSSQGTSQSPQQ